MLSEVLGSKDSVMVISAPVVTFIIGTLIPIINGLMTRWTLSGGKKGLITLVLNLVVSILTTNAASNGPAILSVQTLFTAAFGFFTSIGWYHGIFKPANITSSTMTGKLNPNQGIGPVPVVPIA